VNRRYRWSLRVRLLAVVLLALLPIICLLLFLWVDARQRERDESLRNLRQTTEAVAVIADAVFDEGIALGQALSTDPAIQALDPASFTRRLQVVQSRLQRFRRLVVIDASGTLLGWSAQEPLPAPAPRVADRRFFQRVMATGQPTPIRSTAVPGPDDIETGVAVPLFDDGGLVRGVIVVLFDTHDLTSRLSPVQLFPGQVVTLIDPNGRVVVLLGTANRTVADLTPEQRLRGDLPEVQAALTGLHVTTDGYYGPLSGERRLASFVPTPRHGWVVSATWATAQAFAATQRAQQRELIIFIGIALVILGGAFVASRALIRPLRRLAEHARRLGDGRFEPIPDSRAIREISELTDTFNVMGERLRRSMSDLSEREEMVRALLDQFPASVAIIDPDLRYVLAAGRRLIELGVTADALVGRTLRDLYSDELVGLASRHASIAFAGQDTGYTVTEKGVCLTVSMIPLRTADGAVPHVLTISYDVTEESERRERRERDEKLHALGQMASGIAHNLNQTLALVSGYGELARGALDQSPQDTDELRRMLRVIERAAYDGGETVKRLLTFARGQANERHQAFDVAELLQEVAQLTSPRWRERTDVGGYVVDLRVDAPAGLQMVGVQSGLREAVTNLVFNALDALPHGGSILLSAREADGQVVLEVTDSGQGMTGDVQRRIFEPFFTTKGANGTGLGLAMVFGIVRRHNGAVDVTSVPGEGTSIRLTMPGGTVEQRSAPAAVDAPASRCLRILVVDDEVRLAALAASMLRRDGHEVAEANDGASALARLHAEPFDLVITDLSMGDGMNGWELAAAVDAAAPSIPVILVTGWGAAIDEAEARQRRVRAVLPKPFRIADLRDVISRVMDAASADAAASADDAAA
jgi:signal transduction histidine kinase/ActR/RegA family two-component response regulator/HAMP domain-containing protein